jgi:hypothetical protein
MTDVPNKHGLRRSDLTEDVRRAVRQRCGFACVVCGSMLYQYEHFDPPFEDAKKHRAEGITLLCGGCHDKVTRGTWSKDRVRQYNDNVTTKKRTPRFPLDLHGPIQIVIGTTLFRGGGPLIVVDDRPVIAIREVDGLPFLDAEFRDDSGDVVLRIDSNESRLKAKAWDATFEGRKIRIRSGPGDIVFEAVLHPPNGLHVREIDIAANGNRYRSSPREMNVFRDGHPSFRSKEGLALVTSGAILFEGPKLIIGPDIAFVPFPSSRFTRLARRGEFTTLLAELNTSGG